MAKILNCPKCKVEYWGKIKNAKCNNCGYKFNLIFPNFIPLINFFLSGF